MKHQYKFRTAQEAHSVLELMAQSDAALFRESSSRPDIGVLEKKVRQRITEIQLLNARTERLSILNKFANISQIFPNLAESVRTQMLTLFKAKGLTLEGVHFRNIESLPDADLIEIATELQMLEVWKSWSSEEPE